MNDFFFGWYGDEPFSGSAGCLRRKDSFAKLRASQKNVMVVCAGFGGQ
ncbi:hypothetical protein W822_18035 [Advenella kashmirensis W13003]|uniref:Uncharacterized protein n=1 Tax=Advenella kashmirensis W13003 TaxID=1424334 RepID=V8QN50_9BURK|nr:hypothetical protein W822_18035 [Advenella kashmirensis W13003]